MSKLCKQERDYTVWMISYSYMWYVPAVCKIYSFSTPFKVYCQDTKFMECENLYSNLLLLLNKGMLFARSAIFIFKGRGWRPWSLKLASLLWGRYISFAMLPQLHLKWKFLVFKPFRQDIDDTFKGRMILLGKQFAQSMR